MERCKRIALPQSPYSIYVRIIERDGEKEIRAGIGNFKSESSAGATMDLGHRVSLPWTHFRKLCQQETLDRIQTAIDMEETTELRIQGQTFVKIKFEDHKGTVTIWRNVSKGTNQIELQAVLWLIAVPLLQKIKKDGEEFELYL